MTRAGLLLLVALVACGGRSAATPLEHEIFAGLAQALGGKVHSVRCPAATPTRCQAIVDDSPLLVTIELDGSGGRQWRLADDVVAIAPLRAFIEASLADLGVERAVDCGPAWTIAPPGAVLMCSLAGGGVVWARLPAADAVDAEPFELEIALDPEAVAARVTAPDPVALDGTSRALDSDEAAGIDGADAESGSGTGSAEPWPP